MTKVGHWEKFPEKTVRRLMIRKSGDLLRCVFHQLCVFMVLEDLFCLQKLRLQQSLYGVAAAFLFAFFQSCPPFNFGDGNGRLPTAVSPNIPEAGV